MNHITALAIARSMQQDRLESARRARRYRPVRAGRRTRLTHLGDMARVLLMGFRHKHEPSR